MRTLLALATGLALAAALLAGGTSPASAATPCPAIRSPGRAQ